MAIPSTTPAMHRLPETRPQAPVVQFRGQAAGTAARDTVAPLPAAPRFNRQVAREAPAAHPAPVLEQRPSAAAREAVPERLAALLQAARGRAALAARTPAAAPRPEPASAADLAVPGPFPAAAAPAPTPAAGRVSATAALVTEIRQAVARETFQAAVQERTAREDGGVGARPVARALIDTLL